MQKLLQMKNYLLEIAFVLVLGRCLALGMGISEALVLLSLVSSMAYTKFLNKNEYIVTEEFRKELEDIKSRVNALSLDRSVRKLNESQEPAAKPIVKKYF